MTQKSTTISCIIPEKYIVSAIRSTKHSNSLKTNSSHFVLSLPRELKFETELENFNKIYINWAQNEIQNKIEKRLKDGKKSIDISKPNNGKPWYSMAKDTGCDHKKGNLFLLRKYRPSNRTCLAVFTENKVTVNDGNFYIFESKNTIFYASWLNSAFYFYSLFNHQQITSKGYYYMQIKDFSSVWFPIFSKFKNYKNLIDSYENLVKIVDSNKGDSNIPNQLGFKYDEKTKKYMKVSKPLKERYELDMAWLKVLFGSDSQNGEDFIHNLYDWLIDYLNNY